MPKLWCEPMLEMSFLSSPIPWRQQQSPGCPTDGAGLCLKLCLAVFIQWHNTPSLTAFKQQDRQEHLQLDVADTQQTPCRFQKRQIETLNSKEGSPAPVVLLEALWWPRDCCLCSTSPPRQAAAEGLHHNLPRHSVCISIVTWCNKCWSHFTKHLCQFATPFGFVFKAFLLD